MHEALFFAIGFLLGSLFGVVLWSWYGFGTPAY